MQLQMQQIINFTTFYEVAKQEKLSIKTTYKLAQLASIIEKNVNFYYEKLREIVKQYGQTNEKGEPVLTEDGQGVQLRPGTDEECNKAMLELTTLEVEIPDIWFGVEEFSTLSLTVAEFSPIMPFIKMD